MFLQNYPRLTLAASVLIPLTVLGRIHQSHAINGNTSPHDDLQTDSYFGQTPPGLEPEIFAPGIVSTGSGEGCIVFSADGRRSVFRRFGFTQLMLEGESTPAGWRIFQIPRPFSRLDYYNGDFTLAPDGRSFYFSSRRPIAEGLSEPEYSNAWVVDWGQNAWSEPVPLPETVRAIGHQAYPTITSDGILYFFSYDPVSEHNDIYRSSRLGSGYSEPEKLGSPINSEHQEYDPFISPDGSYLIFASNDRPGGLGEGDFYVSFSQDDGSWSEPVNMGEGINSTANENRPFVTLDGRYFFFTSNRMMSSATLEELDPGDRPGNGSRDIYWVDASLIDRLKPTR